MSELRKRMSDTMCLRGMAARTQEAYIAAVAELARYCQRSPEDVGPDEVQAYPLRAFRTQRRPRQGISGVFFGKHRLVILARYA